MDKERTIKIVKDEKKIHGAVDKSLSEQQFRKSDAINFVLCCVKNQESYT